MLRCFIPFHIPKLLSLLSYYISVICSISRWSRNHLLCTYCTNRFINIISFSPRQHIWGSSSILLYLLLYPISPFTILASLCSKNGGRRDNVPHKDVHFLITGICEYVPLHGRRDLVNAVKVEDLEIIQMGPIFSHESFKSSEPESSLPSCSQREAMWRLDLFLLVLKGEEGGRYKAGKGKKTLSSRASRKGYSPDDTLVLVYWDLCWFLTSEL